jgi:hypothetical protein
MTYHAETVSASSALLGERVPALMLGLDVVGVLVVVDRRGLHGLRGRVSASHLLLSSTRF